MAGRIRYDAFNAYLHKLGQKVDPFYCVIGEELLLRNETVDALRQHCRDLGFSERISLVLDANGPWHKIQENLQNTSLFAEQKILEITIPTGKPGRVGSAALIQLAEQVQQGQVSDCTIILNLPKLDKKTLEGKWCKAIFQAATTIDVPQITRPQLPAWIQQRLALQQQHVDKETLDFIVEKVEGNLFAAHQEILKLGMMLPPGQIDFNSVEQAVRDVARFDVFQLTDAMLAGNTKRSVRILQSLEDEGEALPAVLAIISREISTLYTLAQVKRQGGNLNQTMSSLRIFSSRQPLFHSALQRLSLPKLMGLIQHASDIDRLFKGYPVEGRLRDAWQELKRLVAKTAGQGIL
ncbi:DNA polymerase III subunit delta [Pelistega europaea]|uniref:DNA polymerase III subunit delta n=1 Tax=Pelistega europaea TaxID=106147 RepID=A0A7Y4P6F3_9BURK|nr:DNA polymerase III subunit delta [Pelistega europaea]NOL49859.1 DNA polymerase III subunit delta [Pelistega europaea]